MIAFIQHNPSISELKTLTLQKNLLRWLEIKFCSKLDR